MSQTTAETMTSIRRPYARVATACPLCDHGSALTLPFRYAFLGRHLYGVRCERCRLAFIDPQPTAEEIRQMYSEEYFTQCSETQGAHGPAAYMEMAEESGAERAAAAARLDRSIQRHVSPRGRYLEIGCGPGLFLAQMKALGWQAEGLELSAFAATHAREKLGLTVHLGAVEDGAFPAHSFDAVFMGDVLEHLPHPRQSLRSIREWIRPGGVLVIAVPSTMNLLSARLGMALYGTRGRWKTLRIPPYHLFEYTPATLERMVVAAGYRVLSLRQSAVPLRKMGLRGSKLENAGKVALQIPAIASSRLLNRGGDRLLAIVQRD